MAENVEIIKGASLWRDAWRRLIRNKLAVFGMVILGIMVISVIIGPAIMPPTSATGRVSRDKITATSTELHPVLQDLFDRANKKAGA